MPSAGLSMLRPKDRSVRSITWSCHRRAELTRRKQARRPTRAPPCAPTGPAPPSTGTRPISSPPTSPGRRRVRSRRGQFDLAEPGCSASLGGSRLALCCVGPETQFDWPRLAGARQAAMSLVRLGAGSKGSGAGQDLPGPDVCRFEPGSWRMLARYQRHVSAAEQRCAPEPDEYVAGPQASFVRAGTW
jgi:hypothetical protein